MDRKIAVKCTDGIIYKGILSYQGDSYIRIAKVEPCSTNDADAVPNLKEPDKYYSGDVVFHKNNIIWWYAE